MYNIQHTAVITFLLCLSFSTLSVADVKQRAPQAGGVNNYSGALSNSTVATTTGSSLITTASASTTSMLSTSASLASATSTLVVAMGGAGGGSGGGDTGGVSSTSDAETLNIAVMNGIMGVVAGGLIMFNL
ncbi:hypothetical protein MMC14_009852 [Varicellaria rhodocarpa]|nr:hypothetical protein [Varicellaria rhodocarpa]